MASCHNNRLIYNISNKYHPQDCKNHHSTVLEAFNFQDPIYVQQKQ